MSPLKYVKFFTDTFRKFINKSETGRMLPKLKLALKPLAKRLGLSKADSKFGFLLFNAAWWRNQMKTWDWLFQRGYETSLRSGSSDDFSKALKACEDLVMTARRGSALVAGFGSAAYSSYPGIGAFGSLLKTAAGVAQPVCRSFQGMLTLAKTWRSIRAVIEKAGVTLGI